MIILKSRGVKYQHKRENRNGFNLKVKNFSSLRGQTN